MSHLLLKIHFKPFKCNISMMAILAWHQKVRQHHLVNSSFWRNASQLYAQLMKTSPSCRLMFAHNNNRYTCSHRSLCRNTKYSFITAQATWQGVQRSCCRQCVKCSSSVEGAGCAQLALCLKLIHIFRSSAAATVRSKLTEVCHNTRFIIWSAWLM